MNKFKDFRCSIRGFYHFTGNNDLFKTLEQCQSQHVPAANDVITYNLKNTNVVFRGGRSMDVEL
eukprot:snap_masked-scaffold_8-processed-gene-14.19-mRNA-1 protein AED:1.00 eAED:1.00 QI:0/-1/0/0/-1/1/1/0/63